MYSFWESEIYSKLKLDKSDGNQSVGTIWQQPHNVTPTRMPARCSPEGPDPADPVLNWA